MFITFEGPEGSGKTSTVAWLASWLEARGRRVVTAREPGGTPVGEQVRSLLLRSGEHMSAYTSLLLFNAARAELVTRVLQPALAAGSIVICDRFTDSTLAYQGYGEGVPLETVRRANDLGSQALMPDLTILLDIDAEEGLRRRRQSSEWNTIDDRPLAFHQAVRSGFLALAAQEPRRWLVIDAARPVEEVQEAIASRMLSLMER
ncbi:MAG TPA: dTMP kinase [Chloroflexota bacterium]|nr:dTMP kinase [Chloroflexota bacterium]